ncbi:hypothetical protein ABE504_01470 [Paenibacillus oryzisoli]|uniref:sulfotransferase family protein n=1 Tax=Paenibacillus oryzisoli TaxID=1850517 RepID=UPI003D2D5D85
MNKAICILGMHRSGTSLMANVIHLMDVYLGEESALLNARSDNPEGFWELAEVVDLQEQILSTLRSDWNTPSPLSDQWWLLPQMTPYKIQLRNIIVKHFNNSNLWAWKDPRTCLLLPLWQEVLSGLGVEVKYLFMFRNPIDVAKSLGRRDAFPESQSFGLWLKYNLFALHYSARKDRYFVDYDTFMSGWEGIIHELIAWLGTNGNGDMEVLQNKLSSVIKPSLHRNRTNMKQQRQSLPVLVLDLYESLQAVAQNQVLSRSEKFITQIQKEIDQFVQLSSMLAKKSYLRMQLYWMDDNQLYSEKFSDYVTVKADNEYFEYEIKLPTSVKGVLRLDPSCQPARFEVEYIKIYQTSENGKWQLVSECSGENSFKGIVNLENIQIIDREGRLTFFSLNDDPQIYLDIIPEVYYECQFKIAVKLRCEPISNGMMDYLDQSKISLAEEIRAEITSMASEIARIFESKLEEKSAVYLQAQCEQFDIFFQECNRIYAQLEVIQKKQEKLIDSGAQNYDHLHHQFQALQQQFEENPLKHIYKAMGGKWKK